MRRHAPHAFAMGKRDVGSDAPTKVSLYFFHGYSTKRESKAHGQSHPIGRRR